MNDTDYLYFKIVAKYLNFSEASRRLYISQPALSKQISKLEAEFSTKLFLRDKHNVQLTPAGAALLQNYPKVSMAYEDMKRLVKSMDAGKSGHLFIGIQEGQMVDNKFKMYLQIFQKEYPDVTVNIESFTRKVLMEKLYDNDIDVCIALHFDSDQRLPENISFLPVEKDSSYVVISSKHPAAAETLDYEYLNDMPLILVSPDVVPNVTEQVYQQCRMNGINPPSIRHAPSYSTMFIWLCLGYGFALMNQNIWFNNTSVKYYPLKNDLKMQRFAYYNHNNFNPVLLLFLDILKNTPLSFEE